MPELLDSFLQNARVRLRNQRPPDLSGGAVLYWMQRAQRALDNPALNWAIDLGNELGKPVVAFLGPVPFYPGANRRNLAFLAEAWPKLAREVEQRGVSFIFRPYPDHHVLKLMQELRPVLVVGDENPLREPERWRQVVAERAPVLFATVDADVVVPSSLFSKEEVGARTLRPKLHRVLQTWLAEDSGTEPRARHRMPANALPRSSPLAGTVPSTWKDVPQVPEIPPELRVRAGTGAALEQLSWFLDQNLDGYDEHRNQPELPHGTSGLSAHLHFGHLGPRLLARAIQDARGATASREAFLEQLVVRRELAINYVLRNPHYDSLSGAPPWARSTLHKHLRDPRPAVYTAEQLERAQTADPYWNAAQNEMRLTGRMHGYMRMYWAKKILEWSLEPSRAFEVAVTLNDRYLLDGRDPNGYTGVAWAMGGVHDRPWPERPVFGTIRYMNAAGLDRKFNMDAYVARVNRTAATYPHLL